MKLKISPILFLALFQSINLSLPENKKIQSQSTMLSKSDLRLFYTKKSKKTAALKNSKCFIEVYLTEPQQKNGPGHISASFIKITDTEPLVVTHTSYLPGVAGIINGVFLGFVPVLAKNFPDVRRDDIVRADKIFRLPLSEEEFQRGVAKQQELEARTDEGLQMYAITGSANPVASFIVGLISAYRGSEIVAKKYRQDVGVPPSEDPMGIVVNHVSHHPDNFSHVELLNCTAAVESVLKAVGLDFKEDYVIPGNLVKNLQKNPDFERVYHSLVDPISNKLDDEGPDIPNPD